MEQIIHKGCIVFRGSNISCNLATIAHPPRVTMTELQHGQAKMRVLPSSTIKGKGVGEVRRRANVKLQL